MTLEEALFSYLKSFSGLAALVGTRLYPSLMPQNVKLPAVSFQRISTIEEYHLGGSANLVHPLFQFSCWAQKYSEAKAVAAQIRQALNVYTGTMGGVDGVEIYGSFRENELDFYDAAAGLYHVPVDFRIWHKA